MSNSTRSKGQVRESVPVAENPDVVAYAFITQRTSRTSGKTFTTVGPYMAGQAAPENADTLLADINQGKLAGEYIEFLHLNGQGNGLLTVMRSTNGRNAQGQGKVL